MLHEKIDALSREYSKKIYDEIERSEMEIRQLSGFKHPKLCLEAAIYNWMVDFVETQCSVCGDYHTVNVPRVCETGDGE